MIAYFQVTFWGGWLMYLQPSEIIVLLTYKIIFNFFNCSEYIFINWNNFYITHIFLQGDNNLVHDPSHELIEIIMFFLNNDHCMSHWTI